MKVRKHFRTSKSNIDLIIDDFNLNRISNKEVYLRYCVNQRMHKLNETYDSKLDKILSFIIMHCDYDNMPLDCLARIIMSLSKVTNVLSKGFMSVLGE